MAGSGYAREPLLWVLHLSYGWLSLGFLLLACHCAAFAHGRRDRHNDPRCHDEGVARPHRAPTGRWTGTTAIYVLATLAAILRLLAPLCGAEYVFMLSLAGAAWSGAFGLFIVLYARPLMRPRVNAEEATPI
jgi:uncharacterized protein involved in response to NO